jgi:rhodanese-related sulfurtransferase
LRALAESRIGEVRRLAESFFSEVDGAEPVGMAELAARAEAGDVTVIDVRPRIEYEAGHLPGAVSVPLEELADRMQDLDPNAEVVAYCRGPYCVMAAQAVRQLRARGHHATRAGVGPSEWQAAGHRLELGA